MWNIIKSEFIKLKGSSFYFVGILTVVICIGIYFFGYNSILTNKGIGGVYSYILNFKEPVFNSIVILLMFFIAILVDIVVKIDKKKWMILYSKNIRAKYFWSKYIILIFSILLIFLLSSIIFISLLFFVSLLSEPNLSIILFKETLFKFLVIFFILLPLVLVFLFLSLFGLRAILLFFLIVFFISWESILDELKSKQYIEETSFISIISDKINNYSILKNYSNILQDTIHNKEQEKLYTRYDVNEKYVDKKLIEEYEELLKQKEKIELTELASVIIQNNDIVNYITEKERLFSEFQKDLPDLIKKMRTNNFSVEDIGNKIKIITRNYISEGQMEQYTYFEYEGEYYYIDLKVIFEILDTYKIDYKSTLISGKDENNLPYSIYQIPFIFAVIHLINLDLELYNDDFIERIEKRLEMTQEKLKDELENIEGETFLNKLSNYYFEYAVYYSIDHQIDNLQQELVVDYVLFHKNIKEFIQYFFNFKNKDFLVWFLHFIFIGILATFLMQRRQIYN